MAQRPSKTRKGIVMIATDAGLERMLERMRTNQEKTDNLQIAAHPESAKLCEYNLGRGMKIQTACRVCGRSLVDAVRRRATEQEIAEIAKKQKYGPITLDKIWGIK